MSTPFSYSTTYVLDKSHFSETFDESVILNNSLKAYAKSIGLALMGFAILYFTDLSSYAAWFIVVLGIVDALNVYFKKPWWLARQMISRAANEEITLSIDDAGISSQSYSIKSHIAWANIDKIEKTNRGWLLNQGANKSYLSSRCLSADAEAFVLAKASAQSAALN
jgi:hypothetical protein